MNVTSTLNNKITYRGLWSHDTEYNVGDYVYTNDRIGFYYVALNSGTSQSKYTSRSYNTEPAWTLFGFTYEGAIQWEPYELSADTDFDTFPKWKANNLYTVNDIVIPTSGPTIVYGSDTVYYGYRIKNMVITPDWPTIMSKTLKDNDIVWETRVSYLKLLPEARQAEEMYIELAEVMDYLQLHEEVYFNDIVHKFNDRRKVRFNSLEQIIGEYGYTYIRNALNLNEEELRALVSYLQMIHAYKGNQYGLELVFELMNFKNYHAEEWWQQEPKGEPHTWALYVEMDIQNAIANVVSRIITFTRNYVYPILSKFEITYNVDIIKAVILTAGFIDKEYRFNLGENLLLASTAGFIDKEYVFSVLDEYDAWPPKVVLSGGFIDKLYEFHIGDVPAIEYDYPTVDIIDKELNVTYKTSNDDLKLKLNGKFLEVLYSTQNPKLDIIDKKLIVRR